MSGIPSDQINFNYFHLITPIGVALIAFCIVYCTRFRHQQRQRARERCIFGRACSRVNGSQRRDSAQEFYLHGNSQGGAAEGDARFNLEYQHFPATNTLLHTQVNI